MRTELRKLEHRWMNSGQSLTEGAELKPDCLQMEATGIQREVHWCTSGPWESLAFRGIQIHLEGMETRVRTSHPEK